MTHTCYYRRQVFTSLWRRQPILVGHCCLGEVPTRTLQVFVPWGPKEEPTGPWHQSRIRGIRKKTKTKTKTTLQHVAFVSLDDDSIYQYIVLFSILLIVASIAAISFFLYRLEFGVWFEEPEAKLGSSPSSSQLQLNWTLFLGSALHQTSVSDQYWIFFFFFFFFFGDIAVKTNQSILFISHLILPGLGAFHLSN